MQYVAFLRGIAPGNPNMRNDKLRMVFEKLGLKNVQTVISSGNVLFDTNKKNIQAVENSIGKALFEQLGFRSTAIIRSRPQLQAIVSMKPFGNKEHTRKSYLTVTFLKNDSPITFKLPHTLEGQAYSIVNSSNNTVFSIVDTTAAKTPDLMLWLEKQFTKDITTRTWKTVLKILEKWEKLA